jgi:FlaA1/EpsC-like NDP-sugar epimerase
MIRGRGIWALVNRRRTSAQIAVDAFAWAAALPLAYSLRANIGESWTSHITHARIWVVFAFAVVLQVGVGQVMGLYRGRYATGSFEQARFYSVLVGCVTLALIMGDEARRAFFVPRSVIVFAGLLSLAISLAVRATYRVGRTNAGRNRVGRRALIFGAGEGGAQLARALGTSMQSSLLPVGLLDDDPWMRMRRIQGLRVHGTRADLGEVAKRLQADVLIIAIPSASSGLIRELDSLARLVPLEVLVLPPVRALLGPHVTVGDLRELDVSDLLGRHPIDTDIDSIAGYVTNKRVLVTGAGGSIGSELCRQLSRFGPERLVMLDRDESALHQTQLSIEGRALLDSPDIVLADIRDGERIKRVLQEVRPQVVFHAAALKHMPLLERFPAEAVQTNILGTQTVLAAAEAAGVERFINISTDKAADPLNALGFSKRVAERLTSFAGATGEGIFISVRFGNVLGSRGSVLTSFKVQAANGGPLTVTHPQVTRYFMTVEEAVQLVVQAGAIGRNQEVLVLDMGEPVRIADVAQQFASRASGHVDIVFTGLRPGEKLHECLFGEGEVDRRPVHPLIAHVPVPPLNPSHTRAIDVDSERETVLAVMQRLCAAPADSAPVSNLSSRLSQRADLDREVSR